MVDDIRQRDKGFVNGCDGCLLDDISNRPLSSCYTCVPRDGWYKCSVWGMPPYLGIHACMPPYLGSIFRFGIAGDDVYVLNKSSLQSLELRWVIAVIMSSPNMMWNAVCYISHYRIKHQETQYYVVKEEHTGISSPPCPFSLPMERTIPKTRA